MSIAAGKYPKPYQGLKHTTWLKPGDLRKLAGKYPKPYQGLKRNSQPGISLRPLATAGKYPKPYQGLKHVGCNPDILLRKGRKIPKTLSGIETITLVELPSNIGSRRKIPKTLSGIETRVKGPKQIKAKHPRRKIPKTLSGIETYILKTQPQLTQNPIRDFLSPDRSNQHKAIPACPRKFPQNSHYPQFYQYR